MWRPGSRPYGRAMALLNDTDLAFAGVAEQAAALRSRSVSAPELTQLYLDRIERIDPEINAYRVVRKDAALKEAEAAQARLDAGEETPLLGVPVAVKDNMDIAGETTLHGLAANGEPKQADAAVVARLKAAGAVVLGKTNMPELALWGHFTESNANGPTRNPWNTTRSTNGSSGGNAAAVAAGLAAGAIGSDGGGSIRLPAAACGLFGLKPQRGRIDLAPDADHWLGLSHFGPLTRSVADAAALMDAVAGPPPGGGRWQSHASPSPRRLRIAVSYKPALPGKVSEERKAAVAQLAALLAELGHDVHEQDPDYPDIRPLMTPRYLRGVWEDAQRLDAPMAKNTRGMARIGRRMKGMAARARRNEAANAKRINAIFDDHDLLITPTTGNAPDEIGRFVDKGALKTFTGGFPWVGFTPVWNVTGQPAAAIPTGFDADELPTSAQLIAPPDGEPVILALAAEIEQARPWAQRRPPLATA
jgi:amidase